jgi:hypothetical protein
MVTPFIKENHKEDLRNLEANGELSFVRGMVSFLGTSIVGTILESGSDKCSSEHSSPCP